VLPLAVPLLLVALLAKAASAGTVELVAADERGVTLRLSVAPFDLGPPGADGRREILIPRLDLFDVPGRPKLPYATALVAVPPGAKAAVSVIEDGSEEVRDGLRLTLGERSVVRPDPEGLGYVPTREPVEPIRDGAWPASPADLGEPFNVRRQRVLVVELRPFRYDVAAERLWTRRTLTVRVSFVGGVGRLGAPALAPAPEDKGWEPILRGSVLNYEQGRRWREARPALSPRGLFDRAPGARGTGAAGALGGPPFDEDEPEVRVRIAATGAWALDATELLGKGYPADVPIAEVSVHRHEFVPGVLAPSPPYVTFEVPVEVDDADGDGFLTAGDRIVLYAQSWWERSGLAYALPISYAQRLWGEADYVYATRVRSPRLGLRILPRVGWNDLTPPSLVSYPYTQRWERNSEYLGAPRDTMTDAFYWVSGPFYYNRSDSIRFDTYDLDPAQPASVGVVWTGLLSTYNHFVWAAVKNALGTITTVVDSAYASGKVTVARSSTIPGSALSEGTNRFLMWGKTYNSPPDPATNRVAQVALGFFEATYWRAYRAIQGYLSCNSGNTIGDYEILAAGFTDPASLRVYDVTDSSAVRRLSGVQIEAAGGAYAVRFRDFAAGGTRRRYLVFDAPRAPLAADYGRVNRAAIANLYSRAKGDYLLIVPEAFAGATDPLVTLRRDQGLEPVLAPLEALNDVFNGGRKSPYAIKRFIRYAYDNWDARFVLLVGDASEDPLGASRFSGKDWVPTQRILGPVIASGEEESFSEAIVSDSWYVWCLECANPSLAPKLPDLHIGRLPINSLGEATAVVTKLVNYENVTPDQTWRRKMVLVSDDLYSGASLFGGGGQISTTYCRHTDEIVFRQINDRCRSIILNEAGLGQSDPELFNVSYYVPTYPSDLIGCAQADTCRCDANAIVGRSRQYAKPALFTRLAEGRLWWNFQGHANERVLSHEAFYSNGYGGLPDDKNDLQNLGRPFVFTAFSCHPNAFGRFQENSPIRQGPALGEDLVTLANRGAIASWASAGFELLPSSNTRHVNVAFARAWFADPPRDSLAFDPTRGARVALGEVISKAEIDYFPGPTGSPYERDVAISYNLLGDPATRVSVGSPQAIFFANQTPVTHGVPVRLFTIGDTLRLEGDLVSNARIDQISIERIQGGAATPILPADYTLTPAFPDTTDASGGGRRYHVVYRTHLTSGSYTFRFHTVDRYGLPGTFDAVFRFETMLRAEGGLVADGDRVSPSADLSLLLLSPSPLNPPPAADLALTLNGAPLVFSATPANNDQSGREWILTWSHAPYADGSYSLALSVLGAAAATHTFQVASRLQIQNPLTFPNPFNDEGGTVFSFYLESDRLSKVMVRVYTISGRLIYERTLGTVPAGYQQIPWNGLDAEGRMLANGIYFYRLVADNGVATSRYQGRLVKLRKPRHISEDQAP